MVPLPVAAAVKVAEAPCTTDVEAGLVVKTGASARGTTVTTAALLVVEAERPLTVLVTTTV